jgi:hypothetical protein
MKVMIDGVAYEPVREPLPAWKNGKIADVFLDKTLEQLMRESDTWTCATMDIIHRAGAYHTAAAALTWYRDECARLQAKVDELTLVAQ